MSCSNGCWRTVRRLSGIFSLIAGILVLLVSAGAKSPAEPRPTAKTGNSEEVSVQTVGRLVRIPLPITGTVDLWVKQMVDQVLADMPIAARRPTLVFEFWSTGENADNSQFERSLSLARDLASERLSHVRTVAFIPRSIRGHAVLVALACEEIIMADDATLGEAGMYERSIDPTVRRGYAEIADRRRTIPAAVALGMLDPKQKVLQVATASGVRYVLQGDLPALQEETTIRSIDTLISEGETGRFSGRELRLTHGFVSHLAADRQQLAAALKLSADQLETEPSFGRGWQPIRIDIHSPISRRVVNRVQRSLEDQLRAGGVNFICLSLDSPGGSPLDSLRLANFLAQLDDTRIRTVAYVSQAARADAMLIALACDHLVTHSGAILGGSGAGEMDATTLGDAKEALRAILSQKSRHWSLPVALFDPDLTVHQYALDGDAARVAYFCSEELQAQALGDRYQQGEEITKPGEALQVDGARAQQLKISRSVVNSFDEMRQVYGIDGEPEMITPNWAHETISALASPELAGALLFVGGFALMAELAAPGVGAGGFISSVCFLLYFWSQFLNGTAGWLEVLLFVAGIVFIAVELLVIPGFGVFGLGGGALILASLILASQTFVFPQNEYQMQQLPRSLMTVVAAGSGVFASMFLLKQYLHKVPLLSRLLLAVDEEQADQVSRREAIVDYEDLLGQFGMTTTQLIPSGKALFGDRLIDVISDGEVIPRDSLIVVSEVNGNHVIVRVTS